MLISDRFVSNIYAYNSRGKDLESFLESWDNYIFVKKLFSHSILFDCILFTVFSIMRETFFFSTQIRYFFWKIVNPPISLVTTTSRAKCHYTWTSYTIMKFELVTKNNTYQLYDSTEKKKNFGTFFSMEKQKIFRKLFLHEPFHFENEKKKVGKTFNTL